MRKLTFAVGFGAGYILGARAGRMRYEQLIGSFKRMLDSSTVHDVTDTVKHQAEGITTTVREKLGGQTVGASVGMSDGRVDPYPSVR